LRLLALTALASSACGGLELPAPAERTLAAAIRRGASAPDPDSLREAVVRVYVATLPTQDTPVFPAAAQLCLRIESQAQSTPVDELDPPVPPPPDLPRALDPSRAFLARFAGERPSVVAASSCAEPLLFMMELAPIRRWPFADAEFEVAAFVGYGPVRGMQTYTAELRGGSWVVTSCRTAGGMCDGGTR
jgi:hypothetical protein